MKMSTEIRVKTEKRFKGIYNDLKEHAMGDFHEIFYLCACLGYKNKARKPIGKNGDDRFFSKTISSHEYATYYAMTVKENGYDFGSVQDDKAVINVIEEYANAGMEILLSDFLETYLIDKGNNEPRLEKGSCKELAKTLMYYIFSKSK